MAFNVTAPSGRATFASLPDALQFAVDALDRGDAHVSIYSPETGERFAFTRGEREALRRSYGLARREKRAAELAAPGRGDSTGTFGPKPRRAWRGVFGSKPHETRLKYK